MPEHRLIKVLKESERTPFVTNLLCLLHTNLDRAHKAGNDFALAQILQEAILHTTINGNPDYKPVTEADSMLHKQLFCEYQLFVEYMDKKQAEAERIAETTNNEAKQLARSSLVLHHYFIEEMKQYHVKKSFIAECRLVFCANIEELVLLRQNLVIPHAEPERIDRFDWNLAKHIEMMRELRYKVFQRFRIYSEVHLAQNCIGHTVSPEYFKERIDTIRAAHKRVCDYQGLRHGAFELLAEKIRDDKLSTHAVPNIASSFQEIFQASPQPLTPKTFITQQIKPDTSHVRARWLNQLAQETSFSAWTGKSSSHAATCAKLCFVMAGLLTVLASLIIARVTIGPINLASPDWEALKHAESWFRNKLGTYLLANTVIPPTAALATYQWRKSEYTFKQNTIMSYQTHNNKLPQQIQ